MSKRPFRAYAGAVVIASRMRRTLGRHLLLGGAATRPCRGVCRVDQVEQVCAFGLVEL